MVITPLFVVVATLFKKEKFVPIKFNPLPEVVVTGPLNVLAPDPAFCLIAATLTAAVETLLAETKVNRLMPAVSPILPFIDMFPLPATKVRERVKAASPSILPWNVIAAPFVVNVESLVLSRIMLTLLGNMIGVPFVVISPPKEMMKGLTVEKLIAFVN